IGRPPRVALNETDSTHGDAEFFGDELRLHREHALTKLALASECGDCVVRGNRQPGIQLAVGCPDGLRFGDLRSETKTRREFRCRESDNERAGPAKELPSGEAFTIE